MYELRRIGLHQLHAGTQRIGHVHHVHIDIARHGAGEAARTDRFVVDLHRVVGRTATRKGHVGNQSGETHRTGIHTETAVVIVAEHLARHLAYAVHRRRTHHGILRSLVLGRRGTERADRTGGEQRTVILTGHLQRIHQRTDIDLPCRLGLRFANSRQQGYQVKNRIDLLTRHHFRHCIGIQGVHHLERSRLGKLLALAHVRCDHIVVSVNFTEISC